MSFATDSENDDLGHGYLRRPISVTELLEREGFRPQARSRATRRALSGVAAGAVLALGAVVGSLFLSHPVTTPNGDTLASGSQSGGDIVLAESGTPSSQVPSQSLGTPAPAAPAQANPARSAPVQQQATGSSTGSSTSRTDGTISGSWSPSTNTVTPSTNSASSHAVTQSPSTSQAAPSTQSAPPSSSAPSTASTPSSSSPSTASTPPASSTNPNANQQSSNGGLVGAVTGTLNDLTAPVFNWFGG